MKIPSAILITGSAVCLLLGLTVLAIALSNQSPQSEVQRQQSAVRTQEEAVETQKQALQTLDQRVEEQEKARQVQEEKGNQQQLALQAQQEGLQRQQQEIQKQQEQINIGNEISQKVGPNLLRDMAMVSLKNEKMRLLLAKHGYDVKPSDPGAAKPTK